MKLHISTESSWVGLGGAGWADIHFTNSTPFEPQYRTNSILPNILFCFFHFDFSNIQVLDIVRAAESLALGTHLPDASGVPPKSPIEHHDDKMHKTTTIVMSAHTLDTQPQVCTPLL